MICLNRSKTIYQNLNKRRLLTKGNLDNKALIKSIEERNTYLNTIMESDNTQIEKQYKNYKHTLQKLKEKTKNDYLKKHSR